MARSCPARLLLFVAPACGEGEEEGKPLLSSSQFAFSNVIRIRLALFPFCAAIFSGIPDMHSAIMKNEFRVIGQYITEQLRFVV